MNKKFIILLVILLIVTPGIYLRSNEVDYTNNYPYNYEGYNDYEFINEHTKFKLKYPRDWIIKEIERWSGDKTREANPQLGGVEIYLDSDIERAILEIYKNVSHLPGVFDTGYEYTGSIIIDNEKIADIRIGEGIPSYISMCVTYRNTYEGAILFLEKDVFNEYEEEIYTILSSILMRVKQIGSLL